MLRTHLVIFRSRLLRPGLIAAVLAGVGCSPHVTVDPIEVKPIYLTVDVNVRLDKQLEESFGFEDRIERQVESNTTAPTAPVCAGGDAFNQWGINVMKHLTLKFAIVLLLATATFNSHVHAQKDESRKQIESSLEQRYATLLKAEDQGKVGETWKGFVEAVDKQAASDAQIKKLIDDENADRKRLYENIAAEDKDREKVTATMVGERNALRKFQKARPDHFLKSKSGEWVKKKDLDPLKKDGKIGETWDGYLSQVNDAAKSDVKVNALVDLENRLRRDEYMQAARDQKKTVNEVATAAGAKNLAKVAAGEWYLPKDGQWQKKA